MNRYTLPAIIFLAMLAFGIPYAIGQQMGWW